MAKSQAAAVEELVAGRLATVARTDRRGGAGRTLLRDRENLAGAGNQIEAKLESGATGPGREKLCTRAKSSLNEH
jgi:hypothetical protein